MPGLGAVLPIRPSACLPACQQASTWSLSVYHHLNPHFICFLPVSPRNSSVQVLFQTILVLESFWRNAHPVLPPGRKTEQWWCLSSEDESNNHVKKDLRAKNADIQPHNKTNSAMITSKCCQTQDAHFKMRGFKMTANPEILSFRTLFFLVKTWCLFFPQCSSTAGSSVGKITSF